MEVFLVIKRQKQSIFLDVKEVTTVAEVKGTLQGILKQDVRDIRLIYNNNILEDNKTMSECSISSQSTKAQAPALLGMVFKKTDGDYEDLDITPVSLPPELPQQMKQQESPVAGS